MTTSRSSDVARCYAESLLGLADFETSEYLLLRARARDLPWWRLGLRRWLLKRAEGHLRRAYELIKESEKEDERC